MKKKKRMEWFDNLIQYQDTGNAGYCLKCGSSNIEVRVYESDTRKSWTLICQDCNSGKHFDGK